MASFKEAMRKCVSPTQLKTTVLLGDVGMGKSTIVEKITGVRGLSSAASTTFTRSSQAYITSCGRLQLIDCPGANAMRDKLEHNVWIAHALNTDPVSLILLVVKADTRIDNTVDKMRTYVERFEEFGDLLSVCVTHMDTVDWGKSELLQSTEEELGISTAVCIGQTTPGADIKQEILGLCTSQWDLNITSDNFLKYFKINDSNRRILSSVRQEVTLFQDVKRDFIQQLNDPSWSEKDKVDMVFEFQAYMLEEVYRAQKRVSDSNSFTFMGDGRANEAGHIANMTNQLRAVLFDVRMMAVGYQNDAGVTNLRQCPHCGAVWAKLAGCEGSTTCGNRMNQLDGRFDELANFSFGLLAGKLRVVKSGSRRLALQSNGGGSGAGCGKTINWSDMQPFIVPAELRASAAEAAVSTDDVENPVEAKRSFHDAFTEVSANLGSVKKVRVLP